jgi:hypothetical protein
LYSYFLADFARSKIEAGKFSNKILRQFADIVLKQFKLTIFIQLALLPDIVPGRLFITTCASPSDKITVGPELSSSQVLFDLRAGFKDFSGSNAFDNLHNFLWTVHHY